MYLKAIKRCMLHRQGFTELAWLNQILDGGFIPGAAYLLSGEPGTNKTTLGVQIASSLAHQNKKILMLINEQTPGELRTVFGRVTGRRNANLPQLLLENIAVEPFDTPADLLHLIRRKIPVCYPELDLIIIDSLQGGGLASTATSSYRQYYAFLDETKACGLTTLTLAHVTKAGKPAGPKTLEHKVDVCLVVRKAASLRHLYIPKNRFGPEITEPLALLNTAVGLIPSPHSQGAIASVLSFLGQSDEFLEVQVAVSLPKLGGRAELNAPFLPIKRVRQIITTLHKLPDLDMNDLCFAINALVPDAHGYSTAIDLPLAIAVLSAYLQQPVDSNALFMGGLDLRRNIRPPDVSIINSLAQLLSDNDQQPVTQVYLSSAAAGLLRESLQQTNAAVITPKIVGVRTLDELLQILWPGVIQK